MPPRPPPLLLVPRAQALATEHEVVVVDGYGLDELVRGGSVGEVVLWVCVWGRHIGDLCLERGGGGCGHCGFCWGPVLSVRAWGWFGYRSS